MAKRAHVMVAMGEVHEELEDSDSADEATAVEGVLLPLSSGLDTVLGSGLVTRDLELRGFSPAR